MMIWLVMISILLPVALSNSEGEKWSWPSSQKDQTQQADNRKDIYYENSSDKSGRIRVPTSYYDNRRPLQAYEVKEQTTSRPRPLSDEFSNESTSSGENYGNNINGYNGNRNPSANTPNRFGPQQSNDFQPQFGYGQQYPGQQFPGGAFGAGPTQFPGAGQYPGAFGGQRYPIGQFGGQQYPQQYPIRGQGYPGQFAQQYPQQYPIGGQGYPTNGIGNGILVGPGGPTGIIGRPYGNRYGGGFQGGFAGQAFEGQHNALGGSHLGGTPFGQGAYGQGGFGQGAYGQGGFGQGAYGQGGFGQGAYGQGGYGQGGYGQGGYNPQFGGGFPGPLFDPSNTKNLQVKKIEKSAK